MRVCVFYIFSLAPFNKRDIVSTVCFDNIQTGTFTKFFFKFDGTLAYFLLF